jgi:hypothetical protein
MAALPLRAKTVLTHDAIVVGQSARWLAQSREHTNFTYDLTPRNREHLAWWISTITSADVQQARSFIAELAGDSDLESHIVKMTMSSDRKGLADRSVRYGRRLGWYALVRALQPDHVVETGTDKGLGSCVFAAALIRNGHGRLSTIDLNPDSGYLISGRYAEVTDVVIGDSLETLRSDGSTVDFFLHDSWHSAAHEFAEFDAVTSRLTSNALVLSDNAHATDALATWAEQTGRDFSFFREEPSGHWYPGAGIGAATS